MNGKPIAEFKGEIFDRIIVYPQKVRFIKKNNKDWVFDIPRREIGCLAHGSCKDTGCNLHINYKEYDNCILNIDRTFTLEEIGKLNGVSRQATNYSEIDGRMKFRKRIKDICSCKKSLIRVRTLHDLLPETPEFVVREKKIPK